MSNNLNFNADWSSIVVLYISHRILQNVSEGRRKRVEGIYSLL